MWNYFQLISCFNCFSWIFYTLFETRVSIFQNQVFVFTSLSKFKIVNYIRNLMFSSLFSKLKVVKDIGSFSAFNNLQAVFNMRRISFPKLLFSLYFPKIIGGSIFFKISDFYSILNVNLLNLFFSPYFEKFINRFTFGYRPFRFRYDIFYYLKNKMSSSLVQFSYFGTRKFRSFGFPFSVSSPNSLSLFSDRNFNYISNNFINFSMVGLFLF